MSDSAQSSRLASSAGAAMGYVPAGAVGPHDFDFAHFNPDLGLAAAASLLKHLFGKFEGNLAVQLWNGDPLRLGSDAPRDGPPPFTLVLRNPGAIAAMVLGFDRLRFAEAYFRGDVDIEGDFFAALGLKDHLDTIKLSSRGRLAVLLPALRLEGMAEGRRQRLAVARPVGHGALQEREPGRDPFPLLSLPNSSTATSFRMANSTRSATSCAAWSAAASRLPTWSRCVRTTR